MLFPAFNTMWRCHYKKEEQNYSFGNVAAPKTQENIT